MYRRWRNIILAVLFGLFLPNLMVSVFEKRVAENNQQIVQEDQLLSESSKDSCVMISVLMDDGNVIDLKLEEYLVAVVLREMPASFEPEALKAQAVVARTYTLRRQVTGGKHNNAAVCTNAGCCQGFYLPEAYLQDGGTTNSVLKIKDAVNATAGEVLMYDGALIEATYFSCSGGMTEDAVAVWGSPVPYLVATNSPGEEKAAYYVDTVTFKAEEFADKLGLSGSVKTGIYTEDVEYTAGGGISKMRICGKMFKGTTIRQKLDLRSTVFTISVVGNTVTITTKGFGHRVGMSQYGADAMAVQGSTYVQILEHYYRGTELKSYTQ